MTATDTVNDGLIGRGISLGIVCPMANELATADRFTREVLDQCRSFGFESIRFFAVLDNASTDGTLARLRSLQDQITELRVVWAPENKNVVDAYLRGYAEALTAGCDWILEIDAGYSHQPADIPQFFRKMAEGNDCVFGSRFGTAGGGITETSLKRRILSRGGSVLSNLLLGTDLPDMTSGFELFSRSTLEMVLAKGIHSRAHFFQTEIKTHCRRLKIATVPIVYTAASDSINAAVVADAFVNLGRLIGKRFTGRL